MVLFNNKSEIQEGKTNRKIRGGPNPFYKSINPTNIEHFELRYEKHFADIWIREKVMVVPIIVARGFGKEMVSKIEQIAKGKRCKRIEFSTVINVKLINILEKRGYKYNPCIMEADNPRNLFKETITGWTKEVEDE